ncbi:DegT/DnrJ/EryC1/StrS family aminotransferase [Parasphingorhabdus cellanae]|uniref:DegT/DnrJ/EryC1/StrS family aminotransferase n=1 Tax=Parasphingorhabdus cellanae TaxID=2806553 RepID=A0ABX7T1M7_9SPHN|nr:DegT/DnrJ/EryC1/StrS family aminotransferase [Parasphingorhabdus cellanae]QTD54858.1 DegT/DnrJ/EryC1/StrS family aminotransferase [Parasphingorhabdus cellanae]
MTWIPVNEPALLPEDFLALKDSFDTGWISSAGKYVDQFESDWATYCGQDHGIAVSNGTAALQVAVEAVGIGAGDEVIMPSYTIISCASSVVRAGAKPVLVDCDPKTFGMVPDQVAQKITPRTKAIMVVHMFGHPVDMDPIAELASKHGLVIIEDAAEVHGAKYLSGRDGPDPVWKTCGGMGHIATFSFFANKLITTGEGGMVVTSNKAYAEKARSLRNLCFRPDRRFLHTEHGHQFRMTNMQAAIGVNQVKRIETIVDRKRAIADQYSTLLSDIEDIQLPMESDWAKNVFWVYSILLGEGHKMDAVEFAARLKEKNIETRPFFLGMHEQPVFHDMGLFIGENYPVTERIARKGLYVPSGLAITDEQIEIVSEAVRETLA